MVWLPRKPSRTVEDPYFGVLAWDRRSGWVGKISFPPDGQTLSVSIERRDGEPTPGDRRVFQEFASRYRDLSPSLSRELYRLFEPSRRGPGWEGPGPGTAEELWSMVRLEALHLRPGQALELLFAFRGDIWPDAIFNVSVDGAHVFGLSLDD